MKILSIDVGLLHLAIIMVNLADDYLIREEIIVEQEVLFCDLIDITELVSDCKDHECELYHDRVICDYMMHLFKKFKNLFDSANLILIERQPPTGLVAVQELIMREYRNKSKLISPSAMLNHFGILQYEYLERKVHTEKIAMEYLGSLKVFIFNERRHDMADSLCLLLYYLFLQRKEHMKKIKDEEDRVKFNKICLDIQQFRYTE